MWIITWRHAQNSLTSWLVLFLVEFGNSGWLTRCSFTFTFDWNNYGANTSSAVSIASSNRNQIKNELRVSPKDLTRNCKWTYLDIKAVENNWANAFQGTKSYSNLALSVGLSSKITVSNRVHGPMKKLKGRHQLAVVWTSMIVQLSHLGSRKYSWILHLRKVKDRIITWWQEPSITLKQQQFAIVKTTLSLEFITTSCFDQLDLAIKKVAQQNQP